MESTILCPKCRREIPPGIPTCPFCMAPIRTGAAGRGWGYEWKSSSTMFGLPLVHVAFGRDAAGKWRVARGIIAIGQFATGGIVFAQIGAAAIFGFGQIILAPVVIAQIAIGILFGLGQIATGYVALGQVVVAVYGAGQSGWAEHMISSRFKDPEAVAFFNDLFKKIGVPWRWKV
jgi:hypothetical protein